MITSMRTVVRSVVIGLVMVLWVVSGPIAMAFNGCLLMGGMCEAVCGIASSISGPAPAGAVLAPVAYLVAGRTAMLATIVPPPPSPPPKLALLSA